MFTGIVTHRGRVAAVRDTEGGGRRFVLEVEPPLGDVGLGDSIAVDGVCLTVSAREEEGPAFDVVPETLRRTTLGRRRPGDRLNLEPSLRLGDEMGGHLVQGHVEGVGEVVAFDRQGEDIRLAVRVGPDLGRGLIPKGSIALDGVSLTIGEVWREETGGADVCFSVYLVPHTLAVTGLGERQPGDRLNVEPDVLGRWVEHHVRRMLESTDVQSGRPGPGPTPAGRSTS
ncbi:MAG: riboflavin synthase [Planctomycetota bacterium]